MAGRRTLDVLVVSDVWPPHFIGGYELGAADVTSRLERRGHRVTVLTSTYGVPAPRVDGNVHRLLYELMYWRPLSARDLVQESWRSARRGVATRRFLRQARFDIVYLFNPLGLNARVLQDVADTGRPVVAYVSDSWAAQWPWCDRLYARWMEPRPYLPTVRKAGLVLARRALRRVGALARAPEYNPIRHAQFVSRYIRDVSAPRMPLHTQEIIPWGIDVGRLPYRERPIEELRRWVYVGQIEEHKGVHTAVQAVKMLRSQGQAVELTIFGHDTTPYAEGLKRYVAAEGLEGCVRFAGGRPRGRRWEEAGAAGGLLVFPTMWEEPFSITLLEAFASGLPVLSTLTGGSGEIVRHGETATVFSVGNEQHLAAQWYGVVRHPERVLAMARRARAIVADHLDIERMVDRVETHLLEVAEGRGSVVAEPFVPRPHPWEPQNLDASVSTRALEPHADDGTWLAALWRDLALTPGETTVEPEADSEPDVVFPICFPDSAVLNGRFRHFLTGRILNAGAGRQVVQAGAMQVRLDIQPHNRPDVCADLHHLPFADGAFDSIVSTAVLEHCRRPWAVMGELRRVLRPGGHLLLALPFMQPAHANPSDYYRFTGEGMVELAQDAGFTVVDRAVDNSVQHTLGWVLWELLRHHPRYRYLTSDRRVQQWFTNFTRREGRVHVPTLGNGFCIVARREA